MYGRDGVRPDPAKIQAIKDIQPPKNIKELQSFLGMVTYLAPYIPNLSTRTASLRTLLKTENEFQWNHEQHSAFQDIKAMICQAGNLTYFDPKKQTVIKVDASFTALGAALTQDGKPIAYASKSLTPTERVVTQILKENFLPVYWVQSDFTRMCTERILP